MFYINIEMLYTSLPLKIVHKRTVEFGQQSLLERVPAQNELIVDASQKALSVIEEHISIVCAGLLSYLVRVPSVLLEREVCLPTHCCLPVPQCVIAASVRGILPHQYEQVLRSSVWAAYSYC